MRRLVQSIHLNPATEEGNEILSVLLAIPRYQRGALLRAILAEHIKRTALLRCPGITLKTPDEITELLARRPAAHPPRRPPAPRMPAPHPVEFPSVEGAAEPPAELDVEARLDQLTY